MRTVDVMEDLGGYHRRIYVFLPEHGAVKQVVYFHGTPGSSKDLAEKLWERLGLQFSQAGGSLVALEVEDWNRDLSPWKAAGISGSGEDFAGGGRAYLKDLCDQVIPQIENQYAWRDSVQRRAIGGYSMGGLFALYALMESPLFTDMISVSGSLWYDGIVEYVSEHIFGEQEAQTSEPRGRAYFSLGEREPKTRNPRMRRVGEQTMAVQEIMEKQGFHVHFQWNPGNHFQDESERMERGIRFMFGMGNSAKDYL